jgi:hypothetical protein
VPAPVPLPAPAPAPIVTTSLPYDCNAGYHGCYHCLIKQWSVSKLAWCCQHMGRGCPTTPAHYDCQAGFNNWEAGWSAAKKTYCCQTMQRGCPR